MQSLFTRKRARPSIEPLPSSWKVDPANIVSYESPRTSFDDLDAPWTEDPFPVQERRSSRPSAERPSIEDFAVTWDGTYGREEEAEPENEPTPEPVANAEPVAAAPIVDADPLWDTPVVSESSAPLPPAFEAQELDSVWSPREEEPAAPIVATEPPKQGFFARLFGRKQKSEADSLAAQESAAAATWASDLEEVANDSRELEPADADFADDVAAATVPAEDDFASEAVPAAAAPTDDDFALDAPPAPLEAAPDDVIVVVSESVQEVVEETVDVPAPPPPVKSPGFFGRMFGRKSGETAPPPSTDHSAEDAANLAALLGPITPAEPVDVVDEPPTELVVVAASVEELPIVEEVQVVEEVVVIEEASVIEELPAVIEEPLLDPQPATRDPQPDPQPEKKPGFFSSLLRRVSRSQFIPKAAIEPESPPLAPPVVEIAASAEVIEEVVEEINLGDTLSEVIEAPAPPAEDLAAKWGPPAETMSEPAPPLYTPYAPPAAPEMESTQPFPAFRDARDDFAEEEAAAAAADSGRPTEQVEIPAFDEGEKTDEFEVVPAAADLPTGTIEAAPVGFFGRLLGKKAPVAADISGEGAASAPIEDKTPFVLAKFRTFYNEVIRDKHQKSDVISGFATAVLSAPASDMADPEFAAQLLSKRLSEMLEVQAAESNWTGGDAAKYYPEAQYAMVALADETFATIDWPGRSAWHKHMLEPRMYGTRGADVEFFKRIDKMLKDNPDPPKGARDLARLYLLVIASGFRGKFRVPNVKRPLAEYRRRLYEFSHQVDPLELYAKDRRIFPEAAEHTLASRAVGRFTSAQKWVAAVLILTMLYLGVSHYAWTRLSADLKDVMSRIESTDATGRTP